MRIGAEYRGELSCVYSEEALTLDLTLLFCGPLSPGLKGRREAAEGREGYVCVEGYKGLIS